MVVENYHYRKKIEITCFLFKVECYGKRKNWKCTYCR